VERLDRDEPAPAGSIEAMLVLTGPIDGSLEIATNLPVGDIEARPH
jgi:fructose-1,6-bisphosphatase